MTPPWPVWLGTASLMCDLGHLSQTLIFPSLSCAVASPQVTGSHREVVCGGLTVHSPGSNT